MNKYYKDMILCSKLDYHCLLCKESFKTTVDVEKHMRWEQHVRKLKRQNTIPKYKENIHKIGEIHYCEICNWVLKFDAIQEHIKSLDHKENKLNLTKVGDGTILVVRDPSGCIKFPNLMINKHEWYGIHNKKCVFCNELVENVNDHISTTKHMVYIIQSTIIENEKKIFRVVDENMVYCFVCSDIIKEGQVKMHNCKNHDSDENTSSIESTEIEEGLLESLAEVEKDNYDINITDQTIKCKLCNASINLTMNALLKHTEKFHNENIKYVEPEDRGKHRAELAKYGKENFIKLNEGGRKGYCSLCNIYISVHMKIAVEHVNGLRHSSHLELKGLKARTKHSLPGYHAQAMQHFIKDIYFAKPLNAVCINWCLSVDSQSFMFTTPVNISNQIKGKCFCCDAVFNWDDLNEHWNSRKHKNAHVSVDVLMIEDEFIRVIRPGLFHCGFCNQVFPFWEEMGKHIATILHKIAKKKYMVAYKLSIQCYVEQEINGTDRLSNELYLWCKEFRMRK